MINRTIAASLSVIFIGACQHGSAPVPAVLADTSDETMAAMKAHLAGAMGVSKITLGAGNLTEVSTISVLPPPLGAHETRSLATPTQFNLIMIGDTCYAVRDDNKEKVELSGVSCRAL